MSVPTLKFEDKGNKFEFLSLSEFYVIKTRIFNWITSHLSESEEIANFGRSCIFNDGQSALNCQKFVLD